MHIIVIGAGEVGSYVAEILSKEGNDVAVVEQHRGRLRRVQEKLDVLTVLGSGTHPDVLREAGIDRADLMVAVTQVDEVNLIACLFARQHGVERAVARIEASCLRGHEAAELRDAVGADLVIDPDREVAHEVLDLLQFPGASEVAVMGGGEVIVIGTKLAEDAPLANRTLHDIAQEYEPDWDFLVGAVTRGADTIIPRGDQRLLPDDTLRVVCKRRARRELMGLLGLHRGIPRRVMLLGGGRTAEILADELAQRHAEVTLVEHNPERAHELAERLDGVMVLQGEITDADLLTEADIGEVDAVVALTGEDDANILACLYAKSLGAKETIAVLHGLSYRRLLDQVGIDVALSPRIASANAVLRFVRGGVTAVATFLAGDFEVIEIEVPDSSQADGQLVSDLGLPKDVLIGAIVRDGKAQIARGWSELRGRDHLVVFAKPQAVVQVRRIFGLSSES
ncbi:MAG: Trk system potassium transporter TrkA [Acidimicrobiia bacterium]|nr:Trk system potassium transporter TrkA [Acidimicrobiia bacterium]